MEKSKKIQIRPILLGGHTGPLQRVKYNRDGDILLTCARKDTKACAWFSNTGERLGTYNGHEGMIYDLDTDFKSETLITGSADRLVKIWDLETGQEIQSYLHKTTVRSVGFSEGDQMFLVLEDESRTSAYNHDSTVLIYNWNRDDCRSKSKNSPVQHMHIKDGAKMNQAVWGPLNEHVFTVDVKGNVCQWDTDRGALVTKKQQHRDSIKTIQFSKDKTMFITASADQTAVLWDTKEVRPLKTYRSDRPLNAATISPRMNHVIVGGGQAARDVTTSSTRQGKFEAEFYHMVYQDYMGSIKGHFGPINSLAFSPDGKSYASGSEDGYIRLHHFDQQYFKTKELRKWK